MGDQPPSRAPWTHRWPALVVLVAWSVASLALTSLQKVEPYPALLGPGFRGTGPALADLPIDIPAGSDPRFEVDTVDGTTTHSPEDFTGTSIATSEIIREPVDQGRFAQSDARAWLLQRARAVTGRDEVVAVRFVDGSGATRRVLAEATFGSEDG